MCAQVFCETDLNEIKVFRSPKHLIHQRPDAVDILIADLHEDRAALRQQASRATVSRSRR